MRKVAKKPEDKRIKEDVAAVMRAALAVSQIAKLRGKPSYTMVLATVFAELLLEMEQYGLKDEEAVQEIVRQVYLIRLARKNQTVLKGKRKKLGS